MKRRIRFFSLLFCMTMFYSSLLLGQSLQKQSIGTIGGSNRGSDGLYIHMTVGQTSQSQSGDKHLRIGYEQFLEKTRESQGAESELVTVNAYPNPAIDKINIDLKEVVHQAVLNIYNVSGGLVHTEAIESAQHITLSVQNLEAGIYYSNIIPAASKISYSTKFVISK